MPLMDQPSVQNIETHQDLIRALTALARLLARQAVHEFAEAKQVVDPLPPLNKDEGVGNDQQ